MATILKFSEAAALALHATAFLAVRAEDTPLSAKALARVCRASEAHMTKVCQRLVRSGILSARRGPLGGFLLAGAARRTRLLEIYEAIEGKVEFHDCLFPNRECQGHAGGSCVFGKKVRGLEEEFARYLRQTTLAAVAAECRADAGSVKSTRGSRRAGAGKRTTRGGSATRIRRTRVTRGSTA